MSSKIYIGFSKPKGWFQPFAWAIRKWEGTEYSHVYIRIPSKFLETDVIYQASGMAVNFMSIETFLGHAEIVKEYEFEISDFTHKALLKSAIQNLGKPYSVKGIAGIVTARLCQILDIKLSSNPFTDGRAAYICCELGVQVMVEYLGAHIQKDWDLVTLIDMDKLLPLFGKEVVV